MGRPALGGPGALAGTRPQSSLHDSPAALLTLFQERSATPAAARLTSAQRVGGPGNRGWNRVCARTSWPPRQGGERGGLTSGQAGRDAGGGEERELRLQAASAPCPRPSSRWKPAPGRVLPVGCAPARPGQVQHPYSVLSTRYLLGILHARCHIPASDRE